ncbi:MAG: DUF937 domain-containing protein [Clostridiales bacterium]|nr:DUF937 domain-containing protein [Candidatus Crickella caballi]
MDIKDLINAETLKTISEATGVDSKDVVTVLADTLPSLMKGAGEQNSNVETAASFIEALMEHGDKDSSNMSSFIKNIDVDDGAKIVKHLLGAKETATAEKAAKATGLDKKKILKILAIAAPIIMNQLGKDAKKSSKKSSSDMGDVVTSILKNIDGDDVAKLIKVFI